PIGVSLDARWCLSRGRVAARAHMGGLLQASPDRSRRGVGRMLRSAAGFGRETRYDALGQTESWTERRNTSVRAALRSVAYADRWVVRTMAVTQGFAHCSAARRPVAFRR